MLSQKALEDNKGLQKEEVDALVREPFKGEDSEKSNPENPLPENAIKVVTVSPDGKKEEISPVTPTNLTLTSSPGENGSPEIPGNEAAEAEMKKSNQSMQTLLSTKSSTKVKKKNKNKNKTKNKNKNRPKRVSKLTDFEYTTRTNGSTSSFQGSDIFRECFHCCWGSNVQKMEDMDEMDYIRDFQRRFCRSNDEYFELMKILTENAQNSQKGLKEIIQMLTYYEDPSPGIEGLSIIGGYIWLLTYAVQHLIIDNRTLLPNESNPQGASGGTSSSSSGAGGGSGGGGGGNSNANTFEVRTLFKDAGAGAENLFELAEIYFLHMKKMRADGVLIVKKLVRNCKIASPLRIRPEAKAMKKSARKRIGHGLDVPHDMEESDANGVIWSQLSIAVKTDSESPWTSFIEFTHQKRLDLFEKFFHSLLEILYGAKDLVIETTTICKNRGKLPGNSGLRMYGREMSGAMVLFQKKHSFSDLYITDDLHKLEKQVEYFWTSMDTLYDLSYDVLRICCESRDIVRMCYIYMNTFYHWKLPAFDLFMYSKKVKEVKGPGSTSQGQVQLHSHSHNSGIYTYNQGRILRDQLGEERASGEKQKFFGRTAESRRISDSSNFLNLADFSTSIYQVVVQTHPLNALPEMHMVLSVPGDEDTPEEERSLAPDMDEERFRKNKSKKGNRA